MQEWMKWAISQGVDVVINSCRNVNCPCCFLTTVVISYQGKSYSVARIHKLPTEEVNSKEFDELVRQMVAEVMEASGLRPYVFHADYRNN